MKRFLRIKMIKTENKRAERHRGSKPNVREGINVNAAVYSAVMRDEPNQTAKWGNWGGNLGNTHTHTPHTHTHTHTQDTQFLLMPLQLWQKEQNTHIVTHGQAVTLYHQLSNKHTDRKFSVCSCNLCGKWFCFGADRMERMKCVCVCVCVSSGEGRPAANQSEDYTSFQWMHGLNFPEVADMSHAYGGWIFHSIHKVTAVIPLEDNVWRWTCRVCLSSPSSPCRPEVREFRHKSYQDRVISIQQPEEEEPGKTDGKIKCNQSMSRLAAKTLGIDRKGPGFNL